jgi:hypothetical protein
MQQMNPMGQGGMWDVAVFMGLTAWAYISFMCTVQFSEAVFPLLLIVAAALFTAAIVAHLWAANPQHAPYRASSYHWVAGLATAGAVAQLVAMHSGDPKMAVVWGPVAVAYLLASASVYRPSLDQVITGICVIAVLAVAVVIDGQASEHPFGLAYVAIAVVGIVAIIIMGQASYTGVATRTLEAWDRDSEQTLHQHNEEVREQVSDDVTSRLSREFQAEAEPLLAQIIQSGRITPAEAEAARGLAGRVRERLLVLNSQNWLQAAGSEVQDDQRLVDTIDDGVRAALVALCVGMDTTGLGQPRFELTRGSKAGDIDIEMRAAVGRNLARTRIELAPYIRVVYVVFDDVRVSFRDGEVSLKFKYGER